MPILETYTCSECNETYLKDPPSEDIIEKVAVNTERCDTCRHLKWRWK